VFLRFDSPAEHLGTRFTDFVRRCVVLQRPLLCLVLQAKRMGYGDGFRWMSQYIK
jgi:hypothetical protein